jgi:hypothetical protein
MFSTARAICRARASRNSASSAVYRLASRLPTWSTPIALPAVSRGTLTVETMPVCRSQGRSTNRDSLLQSGITIGLLLVRIHPVLLPWPGQVVPTGTRPTVPASAHVVNVAAGSWATVEREARSASAIAWRRCGGEENVVDPRAPSGILGRWSRAARSPTRPSFMACTGSAS